MQIFFSLKNSPETCANCGIAQVTSLVTECKASSHRFGINILIKSGMH